MRTLLLVALSQLANFYGGNLPIVDSTLRNYYDKSILKESMKRHGYDVPPPAAAPAKAAPPPQKPAVKHQPASASDFKPGRGRPAVDAFFAKNPMAPEHEKLMRAMIEQLNKGVETQLRKNSVASAMGLTLATATSIVDGRDPGDEALRELIAGFNDQLAASAEFQKAKPEEKQAMYDGLLVTTALLVTLETLGKRDPELASTAVTTSKAVLAELGVRAQ